ncbi:MAG: hypothetical protein QOI20_3380 [Acidimicrobiaceae bacterium]|nr:hypothetical protein [Acidimicrobiaceae bacterium]
MTNPSTQPLADLLERGMRHHQLGELEQAEGLYTAVLAREPEYAEALHRLGMLRHRQGEPGEAVELIGRAVALAPRVGLYHYNLGRAHQARGDAPAALAAYREAVALDPNHLQAHARLVAALLAAGRTEEAIAAGAGAVRRWPASAELLRPLGDALTLARRFAPAAETFARLVALRPDDAEARYGLAVALGELGRYAEATASLGEAIRLRPDFAAAHRAAGVVCFRTGRAGEAAGHFEAALHLQPDNLSLRRELADALERSGRRDAAAEHYREILRRATGDRPADANVRAAASFALAAMGEASADNARVAGDALPPPAPPRQYVTSHFDEFAEQFDAILVEKLGYRAPQLLYEIVTGTSAPAPEQRARQASPLHIIDLGCGTGLCGVLFRPLARSLVGIDLSPAMLAKARERNVYDELIEDELVEWLAARPAQFDLAIAADVLIYLGDLAPVFNAVARALRPGGRFAVTAEADDDTSAASSPGYRLRPTRRYAHTESYLRTTAAQAGLDVIELRRATLRTEKDRPVSGFIMLMRRKNDPSVVTRSE